MKIAIVYSSLSGNTKKLAQGMFDSIEGHEKKIFDIKENPDISDFDIVATGFWIDKSFPNNPMKDFIASLRDKKVFLFGTMGFFPDSSHGENCIANSKSLVDESNDLIGYFICNGKISEKLLARIPQLKADTPGMKGFIAAMTDKKNLTKFDILAEHVNEDDIKYCSARFNERIRMEEAIANL